MSHTAHSRILLLIALATVLVATRTRAQGGDRAIAEDGKDIVVDVVQGKGHTFLEQGSWVNKTKPFKASSDIDMEHFIPTTKPTDAVKAAAWEKEMVEKWRQAQKDMIDAVKAKYASDPAKMKEMLGKMNVYPPSQIMDECKTPAEAMEKFKKYNMVPNLGMTEELADGTGKTVQEMDLAKLNKSAEGLYGNDARRWIQNDRARPGNGFVVYRDSKTGKAVTTSSTQLEHLVQGNSTYTTRGSANVSGQFVDKIFDDLRSGGKINPKNMDRLKEELEVLKRKSGVHIDLTEFEDALKSGNVGKAKDALAGAKLQLEFLKNGNTPEKLSMIEKLLVKGGKASGKLMDLLSKVPVDKIVVAVDGMMKVFQAIQMGVDINKGNYVKAMTDLGLMLSPAAISILGTMTQEMLEAAKELGIRLVSGRQDCLDMLSGIYPDNPVYVVDSRSPDVSIETLLLRYASGHEAKLSALISQHAKFSSDKPDVVAANDAKCLAQVIPQWKEARDAYGQLFKQLASSIAFDIGVKLKDPEKKDLKDDIAALARLRDDFLRQYDEAQRNGDLVQRYTDAFQNAIGAKDANPCKNPSIAYFWRMANLSFESYGDNLKEMSRLEYRIQTKTGSFQSALDALSGPGDLLPPETRDLTAKFVYQGPSFESMKPQLDAYGKMVCGEGGNTTYTIRWYDDGEEMNEYSDIAEFKGLEPGPHVIEASLTLFPIGPLDNSMTGLSYRAEIFGGTKITIPEPPPSDPVKEKEALVLKLKEIQELWLPQINGMLTEHMNRTGSLGQLVQACNEQIRAYGCDENELETLGNSIAQNGIDPDDLTNSTGEICGDGVDNNGNGAIDEGCSSGGSVIITVWDSGSLADDSFSLSVTGYGNLGSTPAGGQRIYTVNLPPGTYTATLTCILAPDNAGTYTISFSGGASGSGGSGSFSGSGASAEFTFVVN